MFANSRGKCTTVKQAELEFSLAWEGTGDEGWGIGGGGGHKKLLASRISHYVGLLVGTNISEQATSQNIFYSKVVGSRFLQSISTFLNEYRHILEDSSHHINYWKNLIFTYYPMPFIEN